jgi:hypothetical protein
VQKPNKMSNSNSRSGQRAVIVVLAIALSVAGNVPLSAQSGGSFEITNSVVAGGGGASKDVTKNRFGHEGTVGEHAAGTLLSKPPYAQTAGLWPSFIGLTPTSPTASISGRVLTSDSAPLAGVTINLAGSRTVRTITDANGVYSFKDIETGGAYTITPSRANYTFSPQGLAFSLLADKADAGFTALPAAITANPLDTPEFFVRQQYLDFLNREPDQGGFEYWTAQLNQCADDQSCVLRKRIDVSNAFLFELEFQQTAAYVFRLHRAAFGNLQPFPNPDSSNLTEARKLPGYSLFVSDRARVVGGADLAQMQLALANLLVLRTEFVARYPNGLDGPSFVDAVLATIRDNSGVDLSSERNSLMVLFNSGGRAAVMYRLADDNAQTNTIHNREFIDAEYNRAFVVTQYFGYLKRDPDIAGFLFWLNQVNTAAVRDVPKQHALVCSFITSTEYQERFSSIVTHSNRECPR